MGNTSQSGNEPQYCGLSKIFACCTVLGLVAGVARPAVAESVLVFDRGLPTTNLNDTAGVNRSNVAWDEGPGSTTISMGDNFTLSADAIVTDIRVWVMDSSAPAANAFQLWFGADAGASTTVAQLVASSSVNQVQYAGGLDYERGTSGQYLNVYQVDFTVSLDLAAGTYAFAVSGPGRTGSGNASPTLSASNAALSGSPQDGADGLIYGFTSLGAMDTTNGYPYASLGNGWDKSSDLNVQVFVPEPSSLAVLGLGLAGFGLIRRRRAA